MSSTSCHVQQNVYRIRASLANRVRTPTCRPVTPQTQHLLPHHDAERVKPRPAKSRRCHALLRSKLTKHLAACNPTRNVKPTPLLTSLNRWQISQRNHARRSVPLLISQLNGGRACTNCVCACAAPATAIAAMSNAVLSGRSALSSRRRHTADGLTSDSGRPARGAGCERDTEKGTVPLHHAWMPLFKQSPCADSQSEKSCTAVLTLQAAAGPKTNCEVSRCPTGWTSIFRACQQGAQNHL